MRNPAFTVMAFGLYAIATGLALLTAPETLLGLFGIAPPKDDWVRVLGLVAGVLGAYYCAMARANSAAFFRASLWGRGAFAAGGASLVVLGLAPWQLLIFGAADLAGALWTAWALSLKPERS
jgi:hypothetical protein